jgi:hypothetical protein
MKWIISEACWYHSRFGDVDSSDLIEVSDEEYNSLMEQYKQKGKEFAVVDGKLIVQDQTTSYSQEFYDQQEINSESLTALAASDWKVIRELERLYLSGTDLNKEREALRKSIQKVNLGQ